MRNAHSFSSNRSFDHAIAQSPTRCTRLDWPQTRSAVREEHSRSVFMISLPYNPLASFLTNKCKDHNLFD